ncbi:MAG: sporulation protein YunB [Bacillales bacterium]|jgi:sporulation protein YunB|nr:sporulation protein YunB [Bacillales bacterium]
MKRSISPLRGPLPFGYVLLLTCAVFIFSTVIGIWIVNSKIKTRVLRYSESQTKKIATLVINDAIKSEAAKNPDINEIIKTVPNGDSTSMIQFDAKKMNEILARTTDAIQENLRNAEQGKLSKLEKLSDVELKKGEEGIVYYVPLGLATGNVFLTSLGPEMPIEFDVVGDVETDVVPEIESYGINNAFVKIVIKATVRVQTIAPFSSKETTVTTHVPLVMGMVQGQVPSYVPWMQGTDTSKKK